jgi:hypothetical protein
MDHQSRHRPEVLFLKCGMPSDERMRCPAEKFDGSKTKPPPVPRGSLT